MTVTQQPDRKAFVAYWKDYEKFPWRMLLFYVTYLSVLTIFAIVVRSVAFNLWLSLLAPFVAIGYVILVPYVIIRWVHTRHSRFIRCPHCGDWFGQDASSAYFGPNPKFKEIINTGRCSKCGTLILSDHESTDQMLSAESIRQNKKLRASCGSRVS